MCVYLRFKFNGNPVLFLANSGSLFLALGCCGEGTRQGRPPGRSLQPAAPRGGPHATSPLCPLVPFPTSGQRAGLEHIGRSAKVGVRTASGPQCLGVESAVAVAQTTDELPLRTREGSGGQARPWAHDSKRPWELGLPEFLSPDIRPGFPLARESLPYAGGAPTLLCKAGLRPTERRTRL